jgi:hypothetical protein
MCYATIKIGLNIEAMKVVFQAHNSRGETNHSKIKKKSEWHIGEGKSQPGRRRGKHFFWWHIRKHGFLGAHKRFAGGTNTNFISTCLTLRVI